MEYIKLFSAHTDYEDYIASTGAVLPNVSYCEDADDVHFNPEIQPPSYDYLIHYAAPSKLVETQTVQSYGLHTTAFTTANGSHTFISHDFNNGVGTIEFDSNVISLDSGAFAGCSITAIGIPYTVTSIADGVFYNCSGLTMVEIPFNVNSIGPNAFIGCSSMETIYVGNQTPPTIASNTFEENPRGPIFYVPNESVNAYRTAPNWSAFAHLIYPVNNS